MTPTVERGLRVQICSRKGKGSDTGGDGFLLKRCNEKIGKGGSGGLLLNDGFLHSLDLQLL